MSDTLFTAAPHWRWLIVLYFFIGGIAGGSFFLAALLDLFGRPQDRPIVRTGYYVALLGAVMTTLSVSLCQARPAGRCVAGPGSIPRSTRTRPNRFYHAPDVRSYLLGLRVVRSSPSTA